MPEEGTFPLLEALEAARTAGNAIMEVYRRDFSVEYKEDASPLTEADRAAHAVIERVLAPTQIPVLSEESAQRPYATRQTWPWMWLVDPLDGTKEFIKKNDEFTVNIALIHRGRPVLGVVYAPALDDGYIGIAGAGGYRAQGAEAFQRLEDDAKKVPTIGNVEAATDFLRPWQMTVPSAVPEPLPVVASRSHNSPETTAFVERLKQSGHNIALVSRGSALKLCMVASGEALVYPRLAPTMEWDTAAAQAVVEAMGGKVVVYDEAAHARYTRSGPAALFDVPALQYNRAQLRNPWFVVLHPLGKKL